MTRKPQRRSQRRNNSGPAAAARRRAATDRGLTGDKVPGFDPAAAPLGTDAETGGAPPLAADDPPLPEGARADISGAEGSAAICENLGAPCPGEAWSAGCRDTGRHNPNPS